MVPDIGLAEAIQKVPEANLQERVRAEAQRLRSRERALALECFTSLLFQELSETLEEALDQGSIGAALPMLIDSAPLLRQSGHAREGARWLDRALQQPEAREQPHALLLRAYLALGQLRCALGDFMGAVPPLRRALSLSEQRADKHASVIVSNQLAVACDRLGRYTEAQTLYQNAIQVALSISHEADLCMLHASLSASYLLSNDPERALTVSQQALTFTHGSQENLAINALNRATAALLLELPEAPMAVAEALSYTDRASEPVLGLLAKLHLPLVELPAGSPPIDLPETLAKLRQYGVGIPLRIAELFQARGLALT